MTVSDAIVEKLLDWGVDVVFGLSGDGIDGFMEALRRGCGPSLSARPATSAS